MNPECIRSTFNASNLIYKKKKRSKNKTTLCWMNKFKGFLSAQSALIDGLVRQPLNIP